jgi:hypothetical protein
MNGTYGFVYCGFEGVGIGVFRIIGSALVGVDLAGGKYRGHAIKDENTGEIDLSFEMSVPAGVFLVQGTSPQDVPYKKRAAIKVPALFNDGKPFEVYIAPGPVTMMVKRIPDEFSAFADGVTVDIRPLFPVPPPSES